MSNVFSHPRHWRLCLAGALLGGAAVLSACGGGDSVAGVGTGGTGAFSVGAIRGLGSIVVNGVRYDDSVATITDDSGASGSSEQLQLGVTVEVQGDDIVTPAEGLPTSTARSVTFRSEIKGPISAVGADTLIVLGQTVQVGPSTVFDLNLPNGLSSLSVGGLVEVYGFVDANGVYQATRLEGEASASVYKIRGPISDVNTAAKTFRIGLATIDYSAINLNAALVNGQTVRVELAINPNGQGQWVATRLNSATALGSAASGKATVELEGLVTQINSARSFVVNGVTVDASAVSSFPAGVAVGVPVEVKGRLDNGVLVARKVEVEDDEDREFEIKGNIAALDTTAQTFQIRGMLIDYSNASFDNGTASNLSADVRVEIKGQLNANGTVVQANTVEFKGLDDRGSSGSFEVKGAVAELNTSTKTFVVRGITVSYSTARFDDGVAADLSNGDVVEVKGTVVGGVLQATEVDFNDGSGSYEIKGNISALDTAARTFVVNSVTVSYASASFKDGTAANLRVGARVEVKGGAVNNGVVTASKVEFED